MSFDRHGPFFSKTQEVKTMKRIRILRRTIISGFSVSPGQIIDAQPKDARDLVFLKKAEYVDSETPSIYADTPPALSFEPKDISAKFAVLVTTHEEYLKYLEECIESIDRQTYKATDKILLVDNCKLPEWILSRKDWKVISGKWKNPNQARNKGIAESSAEWIVTIDGDNWLRNDYLAGCASRINASPADVAIVYSDIEGYGDNKNPTSKQRTPNTFDYWHLRKANYLSGSSAIRRSALEEIGGWKDTLCYDDWTIMLEMTARGWKAVKQPSPILIRDNRDQHRRTRIDNPDWPFKWKYRTYGLLTIFAGRESILQDWIDWMSKADLPERTALYILDNSGSAKFAAKLRKVISNAKFADRFTHIDFQSIGKPSDLSGKYDRAIHVAHLYNAILPRIHEDMLITIEDDCFAPLDGLKTMIQDVPGKTTIAGISGVYKSRRGAIVAATGLDFYIGRMDEKDVKPGVQTVGCIAGGFTVWNNAYVRQALPFLFGYINSMPTGWDSYISRSIAAQCGKVALHGDVWVRHEVDA